jgi:DNA-binding CsgD family transcriptional regulator
LAALLLQRDFEIERIEGVLAASRAGRGSVLLIEGAPGIGKTSLLAHARSRAAAGGMRVIAARASELERDFAMGIVRQWFEPALRDDHEAAELLSGAAGLARGVLFEAAPDPATAVGGVLHGLYWLASNLAERAPIVFILDDAQWADAASLTFLAYLAGRIESLPCALIVATRPPTRGVPEGALADVRRNGATEVLTPGPLELPAVETFLASRRDAPVDRPLAESCHRATGGNPFLLGALARTLDGTPATPDRIAEIAPPIVARTVGHTLAHLGPAATALARALATLGEGVDLELTATLADLESAEAREAAERLVDAEIIEDTVPLRFVHPIIAAAVRTTQTALQQADAHRRAAELLRDRGAEVERIALQLMHTTPEANAGVAAELRAAARRARGRGAPVTAAALLARALAEPPSPDERGGLLLELAQAEYAVGRTADAAGHFEQAYQAAAAPDLRALALIGLFQAGAGGFAAQRAMAPLFAETRPAVLAHNRELGLRLWTLELLATHPGPAWDEVARGAEELTGESPGEALLLGHRALPITTRSATAETLAAACGRAARHADALLEEGATALVITGIVLGLWWADRLDDAMAVLDRAIAVAQRRGAVADFALAHQHRASIHRRAGRLIDAEADARTAVAVAAGTGWAAAGLGALIPLVGTLVDQGRLEAAEQELTSAVPDGQIPDSPALTQLVLERMRLHLAQREHRRAAADWDEARERALRHFAALNASFVPDLLVAAEIHQALGNHTLASDLLAEADGLAEAWGTDTFIGLVRHQAARLERGPEAPERLREAVTHLARSPARLELARALVSLGEALRRAGRRAESREPLREGYELARRCGAATLAETARTELRASGVRLRREALTGVESLTASERRIAEMAATGASNPEIAQALFLTVKTVESHLTHAYQKLDIAGRSQLADALAEKPWGRGSGCSR